MPKKRNLSKSNRNVKRRNNYKKNKIKDLIGNEKKQSRIEWSKKKNTVENRAVDTNLIDLLKS